MGRPYTMKEMKQIVEYLVEQRAYSEVRGRRMWVNMANARVIDRTWQSLKETFIKRILPDIHNPYYKLNVEQISSFRQMTDVTDKTNNKLVIRDVSDESNASENRRPNEQVIKKEDERSGEGKCSKIQNRTRSSTETLVLENCSEVSSDNQKDVESRNGHKTKSLRDLITYSEPLTPMLQEVVDDFTSDDEPPLRIVEEPQSSPLPPQDKENNKPTSPPTIRESISFNKTTEPTNDDEPNKSHESSKIKSLKLKKTQKGTWENKEPVNSSPSKEKETNNNDSEGATLSGKNCTVDTQLPNNQEGLAFHTQPARVSTESSTSDFVESRKKKKAKRKRSRSLCSVERKKKRKDNIRRSDEFQDHTKDTQTFDSHPQAANLSHLAKELETTNNEVVEQTNTSDDTNIPPNLTAEKTNEGTSQEAGPSGLNDPENPCLKPASLFAEQFSQSKYSDSENEEPNTSNARNKDDNAEKSNDNHENTNNTQEKANDNHEECNVNNEKQDSDAKNQDSSETTNSRDINDKTALSKRPKDQVVLLKSHSGTESEGEVSVLGEAVSEKITLLGKTRETALARVFGFSCVPKRNNYKFGRTNSNRYRNRRRSRIMSNAVMLASESSDDSTTAMESAAERRLVPVPAPAHKHAHKHTHTRALGAGGAGAGAGTGTGAGAGARKRRHSITRQYVEPKAFDIAENPTDSNLYVVGRNKLYPLLIKNGDRMHYGKLKKNDCRCGFVDPSKETFWKEKYLEESKKLAEEKIRADELARLLRQAKVAPSSPILQPNVSLSASVAVHKQAKPAPAPPPPEPLPVPVPVHRECKPEEMIKIKFTKNKEIELEGQWSHVTPVLEKMVAMFNNAELHAENNKNNGRHSVEPEKAVTDTNKQETAQKTNKNSTQANNPAQTSDDVKIIEKTSKNTTVRLTDKLNVKGKEQERLSLRSRSMASADTEIISSDKSNETDVISSGKSSPTPVIIVSQEDPIREKVKKIESEIFKVIEEIDKSDHSDRSAETAKETAHQNGDDSEHVTKRKRGRPRKVSSALSTTSEESVSKRPRRRTASRTGETESSEADKPVKSLEDNIVQKDTEQHSLETAERAKSVEKNDVKKSIQDETADRAKSVEKNDAKKSIQDETAERAKSIEKNDLKNTQDENAKSIEENVQKVVEQTSVQKSLEVNVVKKGSKKVLKRPKVRTSVEESDSSGKRVSQVTRRYGSDSGIATKRKVNKKLRTKESLRKDSLDLDDDNTRFMLPPKGRKPNNRNYTHQPTIPSPESSRISESTQGYQDSEHSEPSPSKVTLRKKKKLGTVGLSNKRISNVKRKSSPYLADDDSCSNEAISLKSGSDSTVNSAVYKSESYQLLMPKARQPIHMDKIEESPSQNATGRTNFESFTPITVEVNNEFYVPTNEPRDELLRSPEGNSSNFSLPLSPVLSVVENLTVSREIIGSSPEHPFINEMQTSARDCNRTDCNKYLISEVDVSMPLMQQHCELYSKKTRDGRRTVSASVGRVSVNGERTDDSLEKKLGDLLLESAKKIAEGYTIQPAQMDVDAIVKKSKPKRSSSTPNKRRSLRQLKTSNMDPVLEEHTDNCSRGGRKSCPPIINIVPCEDNNNNKKPKGRKVKDIIRVKIGRPRRKSSSDKLKASVCTDSGINDTGSLASLCKQCCEDDTHLIHNHSDTCLHLDDCITDSVVFIENANSIISLTSSLPLDTESSSQESKRSSEDFVTPESYCSNAQDAIKINASKPTTTQSTDTEAASVATTYLTPDNASFDSLMTEDLSDELPAPPTRSTNWYLFNDDETKSLDTTSQNNDDSSVGSNLRKLFPLTCAVPDLSTITEMSKDNDTKNNSQDSQMDTFSQTIFELQF